MAGRAIATLMAMRTWHLSACCLLSAIVLVTGCGVQRELHITSDPSGALVYLNDQEVGRTPLVVPFKFYGKYDVRMEAEGYEPLLTIENAEAPWWENPGPDLVAEAVPGAKSIIEWHFEMQPQVPIAEQDTDALLDRARQMQALTRQGSRDSSE